MNKQASVTNIYKLLVVTLVFKHLTYRNLIDIYTACASEWACQALHDDNCHAYHHVAMSYLLSLRLGRKKKEGKRPHTKPPKCAQ